MCLPLEGRAKILQYCNGTARCRAAKDGSFDPRDVGGTK
jgi:hypothetical protein